jgi:hypothetical protein
MPTDIPQQRRAVALKRVELWRLLLSFTSPVLAILVKNQMGDLPIVSFEKLELGVDNFHEELVLRLRKKWEFTSWSV